MTFSAPPVKFSDEGMYPKGLWIDDTDNNIWIQVIIVSCANEDVDGDGILDEGEEFNNDGLLTPVNVVSMPASSTTDINGQTIMNILYAKQFDA